MSQILTNDMHPSLGKLLEYHRKNMHLTREELSDGVCSSRYLLDLEKDNKQPTLYMMNLLCDKLNLNLFDEYALLIQHHNIETHKRIVELNEHIATHNLEAIRKLVAECDELSDFKYGEPYFFLIYLKTLILLCGNNDTEGAVSLAYSTIKEVYPSIGTNAFTCNNLTNSQLNLLLIAASYSADLGKQTQAKQLYVNVLSYLKHNLQAPQFVVNRNHHYEINLYSTIYFNYFSDFHDTGEYLEEYLDFLLDFQKNSKNETNQAKLFFCKAYILLHHGDKERAKIYYYAAYYNGLLLLGEETTTSIQNLLFPDGNPFS